MRHQADGCAMLMYTCVLLYTMYGENYVGLLQQADDDGCATVRI